MTAWRIRGYEPGDEAALALLFQRVYGRVLTPDQWHWKVKGLPSIVENVWVVEAQGQLAGQYAVMPVPVWVGGGLRQAMVGVDAMVDPAYRRQGLWTALVQHAHQSWADGGVAYAIGLPNEQWGSRIDALGWQTLFPLQWLSRPLRPEVHLARRLKWSRPERASMVSILWNRYWAGRVVPDTAVSVQAVKATGPVFDQLWQKIQTATSFSVARLSSWVQWRFLDNPLFDYRVLLAGRNGEVTGYAAYRLHREEGRLIGFIGDLVSVDAGTFATLLQTIVNDSLAAGADSIVTQAVPDTAAYPLWRRAGFAPRQAPFTVRIVPLATDLPLAAMRKPQNWLMSGADFDAI
jgi:GNAT superfamily N-acetyltransferase